LVKRKIILIMNSPENFERHDKIIEEPPDLEIQEEQKNLSSETKQETEQRINHEQEEIKIARQEIEQQFTSPKEFPKNAVKADNLSEKKERPEFLKRMGIRFGKSMLWATDSLRNRVDKMEITTSGQEHLEELKEKSYLIAPNHIRPKNLLMRAMGISPDAFIIERIIDQETHHRPRIITNITGKIGKVPLLGYVDKIISPFREGIAEGMGFIPVRRDKSFNRNFVEKVSEASDNKEPMIIFPQGHWHEEFNPDENFQTGTATIARGEDLPIVPVYIDGGHSWSSKTSARVRIGRAIEPGAKTKQQITREIKDAITLLSDESE